MTDSQIIVGDVRTVLPTLPPDSFQVCVTSPPYFGLRDYGQPGQIGLEASVESYVAALVAVFQEVRRVLKPDGTLWLNLGDSYFNDSPVRSSSAGAFEKVYTGGTIREGKRRSATGHPTLKPKDLIGIPWRVAFALQADGWYLRSDIIWAKPNPMPESVKDRPTKAHEYLFLLSKAPNYYYNADAIAEPSIHAGQVVSNSGGKNAQMGKYGQTRGGFIGDVTVKDNRNRRSVWTIATQPYKGAHFATFPEKLIEPCILAGSRPGDRVLDPFAGSGTTGAVAGRLGRDWTLIELSPDYAELARQRTTAPPRQPKPKRPPRPPAPDQLSFPL